MGLNYILYQPQLVNGIIQESTSSCPKYFKSILDPGGGGFQYFYVHLHLGKWSNFTNIFQMSRNHQLEKDWENHLWNDRGFFGGGLRWFSP